MLVVHTCLLTGEFGIVYKAQLAEMGTHPSLKTVAVKTLKGLEIFQCVSMQYNTFTYNYLCDLPPSVILFRVL